MLHVKIPSKHAVDAGDTLQFDEIQQAGGWDYSFFHFLQSLGGVRVETFECVASNHPFKLLIMCLLYTYFLSQSFTHL